MRLVQQTVPVAWAMVDGIEAPGRFRWRNRWWQVVRIQSRWVTTPDWWDGPAARALRGGVVDQAELEEPVSPEQLHWRVEARILGQGRLGVFELIAPDDGADLWVLDRVHD